LYKYVQFLNGPLLGRPVPARMDHSGTGQYGFQMVTVQAHNHLLELMLVGQIW
jgi:hypothetical protein